MDVFLLTDRLRTCLLEGRALWSQLRDRDTHLRIFNTVGKVIWP